jgi:hypothetical protein
MSTHMSALHVALATSANTPSWAPRSRSSTTRPPSIAASSARQQKALMNL